MLENNVGVLIHNNNGIIVPELSILQVLHRKGLSLLLAKGNHLIELLRKLPCDLEKRIRPNYMNIFVQAFETCSLHWVISFNHISIENKDSFDY